MYKPKTFSENCRTCKNAETKCKPSHIAVICQKSGIGLSPSMVESLESIGCMSYEYDGKGITDLERRNFK